MRPEEPNLALRLAVFVCVGGVCPVAMAGCDGVAALDDPHASRSVAPLRSPESQGSAILELLREAGGPEVARTMAIRDAADRMERAAPAEWAEFLVATEAFRVAAPLKWAFFVRLFLSAAREAPITDAEQDAMRAALDELHAEMDAEEIAAAQRWADAGREAAANGIAVGFQALMVSLVLEGQADEALARYARTVGTEYPAEYAKFLTAVEAVESAAPDAWAEFVKVGALAVWAPSEAWR